MTVLPFAAIASSSTIAPRVEIYTILACKVYKPEYTSANPVAMGPVLPYTIGHFNPSVQPITVFPGTFGKQPLISPIVGLLGNRSCTSMTAVQDRLVTLSDTGGATKRCASDPEVQAAVAELAAGESYHIINLTTYRTLFIIYYYEITCL